ncbi:MAG: radical SAM protein, partial [Oscillospiraceae bacterium]
MENNNYKEITCESALNKLKRQIPYGWDLNIYRGCAHGCKYCYAMYSHKYLDSGGFFDDIYVKTNIVEQLEKELSAPSWKREIINIGGVTDSYQSAEATYKIMPEILKLLIKYKTPAIISTKSTLVLRDYDLIDELSQITYIN